MIASGSEKRIDTSMIQYIITSYSVINGHSVIVQLKKK